MQWRGEHSGLGLMLRTQPGNLLYSGRNPFGPVRTPIRYEARSLAAAQNLAQFGIFPDALRNLSVHPEYNP